MNANDFLRPLSDDLELESLRFPGEEMLRGQIERRPAAIEMIRRWCSLETCPAVPKEAHREAFSVSPAAVPGLAQLARMLETILGLDARPELVVFPSPNLFLGVDVSDPDRPYRVVVASAAIERMGVREAMFQIGRKLAWRLFEHVPFLGDPTSGIAKPDADSLMVRGLWKFQELTCDRIGLLCCQDAGLAGRSILRFASGLPDELLQIDWDALLGERIPEEEAMLADSPYQFGLLRAAALRQFATEDRYPECFVARVKAIVSKVEPMTVEESIVDALVVDAESSLVEEALEPQMSEAAPAMEAVEEPLAETTVIEEPVCETPSEPEVREIVVENIPSEPSPPITEEEPIIVSFTPIAEPPPAIMNAKASEETEALREFTLWGVLWVVGVDAPISDLARAELWEYFGSEAAAAIDEAGGRDGDERCARRCAAAAPMASRAAFELRRGIMEDVIHLALSAGPITAVERDRLTDLAELLDLTPEDVEEAAAEVIDPEFAEYPFREGQDVEARFDDEWTSGVVHTVDSSGGVRVYFPSLAQTLWLHPTSDLLRPVEVSADRLG
jgi:hypothetical protein